MGHSFSNINFWLDLLETRWTWFRTTFSILSIIPGSWNLQDVVTLAWLETPFCERAKVTLLPCPVPFLGTKHLSWSFGPNYPSIKVVVELAVASFTLCAGNNLWVAPPGYPLARYFWLLMGVYSIRVGPLWEKLKAYKNESPVSIRKSPIKAQMAQNSWWKPII